MIPRRWAHTYPGEWRDLAQWNRRDSFGEEPAHEQQLLSRWESAFAKQVGRPHAAAINSGRKAMGLIFEHLGVGQGDEVIVPAYTFKEILPVFDTLGAKAVPADIDPETFNMTPASVEGRISDRTRAILALHIFGVPCDIHGIMNLANRHGIPVVEDCAHSLGSSVSGTSTGCFGSAAFYSFDLIKLINTFGGGMVLMDDAALAARVRSCNQTDPEGFTPVYRKARAARIEQLLFSAGLMYPLLYLLATPALKEGMNRLYRRAQSTLRSAVRYDAPQAQLGLHKLTTLEQRIEMRLRCADVMRSLLHPSIHVQRVPEGCEVCGYAFVVLLPCPAAPVRKQLLLRGIDAAVEGEIMDDCAAALGYDDCPVISDIFPRLLALPMHDRLSEKEAERVARSLNASI